MALLVIRYLFSLCTNTRVFVEFALPRRDVKAETEIELRVRRDYVETDLSCCVSLFSLLGWLLR